MYSWSAKRISVRCIDGPQVKAGIAIGIGVSIMIVLKAASRPSIATLGRLHGTDIFRNIERYPSALEEQGIVLGC